MAIKYGFGIALQLLLFLSIAVAVNGSRPKFFDVTKYGAIPNGKTDASQAFLKAWRDGCAYHGRSRVWIPRGTYMLGSITFEGPCNGSMAFLLKGTLIAPTDPAHFSTDTWIGFRYIDDLTVKGGGYLDGQGASAWKYNNCQHNPQCRTLPSSLRFDFVTNSRVSHIRSINSKNAHINIFACDYMNISNIRISAPANSPNTDGIKIGFSTGIKIAHAAIQTGDDCIAMISGTQNIEVSDVYCGPGHGISIGSLGRGHDHDYVMDVHVRNCTFLGSDNGVRIKTWAPSLTSVASNITFEDIKMINTRNPIVIDQQYCPYQNCLSANSAVQIRDVVFKDIWGTSSSKVAVSMQCSGAFPCKNVKLININLAFRGRQGQATASCSHVLGSAYGKQNPSGCL